MRHYKVPKKNKHKNNQEKGKSFEDKVAYLYRILGATVRQNIQICNKKVDILATYKIPGSTTEHKILVECKDELRPKNQNQRIMEFKGLLEVSRSQHRIDSVEIVTSKPWGDAAKGFAEEAGVQLTTYGEKLSKIFDFELYLKSLINLFNPTETINHREPPLGQYYVELKAKSSPDHRRQTSKTTLKNGQILYPLKKNK